MSTCAGTNQDGSPCHNAPMSGSAYCHVHQDQAHGEAASDASSASRRFARGLVLVVSVLFLLAVAVRCEVDHWVV
ncbi:MAG: hypothetical protein ACLFTE_06090 [Salinivenus sp.]